MPFALVAAGGRLLVPRLGDAAARRLCIAAPMVRSPAEAPEGPGGRLSGAESSSRPDDPSRSSMAPPIPSPAGSSAAARRPPARSAAPAVSVPAAGGAAPGSIVVGEKRAEALVPRLRDVRATTARDADGRPFGARLSGVSALGIGLEDGDVVTSVAGRLTPTPDDALAAAIAVHGSGAREIRATVARGPRTIAVVAAIPVDIVH